MARKVGDRRVRIRRVEIPIRIDDDDVAAINVEGSLRLLLPNRQEKCCPHAFRTVFANLLGQTLTVKELAPVVCEDVSPLELMEDVDAAKPHGPAHAMGERVAPFTLK